MRLAAESSECSVGTQRWDVSASPFVSYTTESYVQNKLLQFATFNKEASKRRAVCAHVSWNKLFETMDA